MARNLEELYREKNSSKFGITDMVRRFIGLSDDAARAAGGAARQTTPKLNPTTFNPAVDPPSPRPAPTLFEPNPAIPSGAPKGRPASNSTVDLPDTAPMPAAAPKAPAAPAPSSGSPSQPGMFSRIVGSARQGVGRVRQGLSDVAQRWRMRRAQAPRTPTQAPAAPAPAPAAPAPAASTVFDPAVLDDAGLASLRSRAHARAKAEGLSDGTLQAIDKLPRAERAWALHVIDSGAYGREARRRGLAATAAAPATPPRPQTPVTPQAPAGGTPQGVRGGSPSPPPAGATQATTAATAASDDVMRAAGRQNPPSTGASPAKAPDPAGGSQTQVMGPGPAKPGSGANPEFLDDAVKQMRDARANKAQEWLSWVDNLDDVPPQMRNAIRQIMDAPGGMFADDVVARAAGNAGTFGGSVRMAEEVLQEQVGLALNHWRRTGTVPDPATVQRIAQQARKNVEGIYTNTGFRNIGAVADLFNPKRGGSLDDFLAWRNAQRQAGSMNQARDAAQKATGATQGGTAGSIRQFIQDHPWPAVAGGALGGMALGGFGDDDTTVTVA